MTENYREREPAITRFEIISSMSRTGFWHGYYSRLNGMSFNPDWGFRHLEGEALFRAQLAYEDGRMVAQLAISLGREIPWSPKKPLPGALVDFWLFYRARCNLQSAAS